ncbi:hypothetical protein NPIL_388151 [Nephila pilipes]|uniref:Uncharacterized protein n=1 Tax=Nephila pilipes TaxID=299642 RepID=A0A8X6U8F6_NEPPI|nr:hypothetical protein NPIL_388151 [Nephila pilipes]
MSDKGATKSNEEIEEKSDDNERKNDSLQTKKEDSDNEPNKEKDERKVEDLCSEDKGNQQKIPRSTYFLLGYEFGEQYTSFTLRTLLTVFLTQQLQFEPNTALTISHFYKGFSSFMPLFGGILADSWLGKFKVIIYLSILYAFGNFILTVGPIPNNLFTSRAVSLVGLFIIAIGTGSIRPCITAFVGDQFEVHQTELRIQIFSFFYFVINFSRILSTAIAPFLRNISCFEDPNCFPLAFFVSSVLFIIALGVILFGKSMYVIKQAEGSVFLSVFQCMSYARHKKAVAESEKREHWLDYADDKYRKDIIYDIKCLLNLLLINIPFPLFWTLFDLQGSRWVFQAVNMNGELNGFFIRPEQMQIVNPIMFLLLIPLFEYAIYPLLSQLNICSTPLQRMTVGGILSAFAFIIAAFIHLKIESEFPHQPPDGMSEILIINNSPCNLLMKSPETSMIRHFEYFFVKSLPLRQSVTWQFVPFDCSAAKDVRRSFNSSSAYESMMVTLENNELHIYVSNDTRNKRADGNPNVRLFFTKDKEFDPNEVVFFTFVSFKKQYEFPVNTSISMKSGMTEYYPLKPAVYDVHFPHNISDHEKNPTGGVKFKTGGSYTVYVYQNVSANISLVNAVMTVKATSVHILWQIPQIFVITVFEYYGNPILARFCDSFLLMKKFGNAGYRKKTANLLRCHNTMASSYDLLTQ